MKIGLQLYSVGDKLYNDFEGTLKAISDMGYEYVETAGYHGRTAEEMKMTLDKYGLKAISVHNGIEYYMENDDKFDEILKPLGVKYAVVPFISPDVHKGRGGFAMVMSNFKKVSKKLKESGITLLYHNHWQEFSLHQGMTVMDWMLRTLTEEELKTEFDVGWISFAGYDPCAYLEKYKGRCPIIHLKDYVEKFEGIAPNDNRWMDGRAIGSGCQDIPKIFKAAEAAGTEYAIVEDESGDIDSLEMVKASRDYLKSIGY